MSQSQALVYAILVNAHHDSRGRNGQRSRHTKRSPILPQFLG